MGWIQGVGCCGGRVFGGAGLPQNDRLFVHDVQLRCEASLWRRLQPCGLPGSSPNALLGFGHLQNADYGAVDL